MFSFPIQVRLWIAPLVVALLSLVAMVFEPKSSEIFALTPAASQWSSSFQFLTGHLLHTNNWHLLLNLLGMLLLWALHGEYYEYRRFAIIWIVLSIMTGAAIHFTDPNTIYVGLSGVLHGLFVWGAVLDCKQGDKTGFVLLIGIAIKIVYEQFGGDLGDMESLIDAPVAINSHLFGAMSGLIIGLITRKKKRP